MKLLFMLPEFPPYSGGGIATYYSALLASCVAQGHTVDVVLCSRHTVGDDAPFEVEGARVSRLRPELFQGYYERFRRFAMFPELRDHLAAAWAAWEQAHRGRGYDLVEAADWGLGFVPWIVDEGEVPVLVRLHGSTGQIEEHDPHAGNDLQAALFRMVEASVLPHADALATYSRTNQQYWQELLGIEVHFHYPGLAAPKSDVSQSAPPAFGDGLVVGRVQYWKGPTVVCEAMRLLGAERPQLTWVGRDMPYRGHPLGMQAYLREHYPDVWGRDVTHRNQLLPGDVRALQARAAFGLVPSTWDVFNLVCTEFMLLGRPVVCSSGAGASGLIVDGENGFLFAAKDPHALRDALLRLRGSASRLPEIAQQGRETVAAELAVGSAAEDLLTQADTLVACGRRASRPARWTRDFVSPVEGGDDYRAVLDHLPLRSLMSYNLRRGVGKIAARRAGGAA